MAHQLQMHLAAHQSKYTPLQQEQRRRIWWALYEFDRCSCIISSLPFSIQDVEADVGYPRDDTFWLNSEIDGLGTALDGGFGAFADPQLTFQSSLNLEHTIDPMAPSSSRTQSPMLGQPSTADTLILRSSQTLKDEPASPLARTMALLKLTTLVVQGTDPAISEHLRAWKVNLHPPETPREMYIHMLYNYTLLLIHSPALPSATSFETCKQSVQNMRKCISLLNESWFIVPPFVHHMVMKLGLVASRLGDDKTVGVCARVLELLGSVYSQANLERAMLVRG
jgi:Fungal specific transcription factor domain